LKNNNAVSGIWNGLNDPKLTLEEAQISVLGLPFDEATSFRKGAAQAPDRLRSISGHIPPTTEEGKSLAGLKVFDLGNLGQNNRSQTAYFDEVEEKALEMFRAGFATFIGGDHSVSIPLINAAASIWGSKLGIIHLDAHMDLCQELDGNLLSHGCTHRRTIEKNKLALDQIWFIGIRSFEEQELQYLEGKNANIITAAEISALSLQAAAEKAIKHLKQFDAIYLTLDIDFLDPAYAPGTGTPKPGGFTTRDLLTLISLFSKLPMIGLDVVEVSPPLDHNDITSFAAQRAITETWAHLMNRK